ncbi:serine protease [Planctomyces sp. SH-PL14]|uniref:S1 family peptidase n=1 Tax=Planctomyces sp. SH-PL14 TaxID=1632864 RepID=UPI00078E685D|nr:serine protease [Planctomyces sp. SH-PL14]AMV18884.1 hypothetical protein VT03_13425 [Planctomyces sp. SH-PL14]
MVSMRSMSEGLFYSTVRIECDNGVGTGFRFDFAQEGDQAIPTIVTNKHVVDGATTGTFRFHCANISGLGAVEHGTVEINPFRSQWIDHPDPTVDLCVFCLAGLMSNLQARGLAMVQPPLGAGFLLTDEERNSLFGVEEVLMAGYPLGLADEVNNFPIIRRGVTASNILFDYQGRKEFAIDIACFPGSSGSPVVIMNEGSYRSKNGIAFGDRLRLIGVLYAAPMYKADGTIVVEAVPTSVSSAIQTEIPMNLAFVIKAERLLEFEPLLRRLASC